MSITASKAVETALRLGQVKGAETPLSNTEIRDGVESLNRMIAQIQAEGIDFGQGPVTESQTLSNIPDYALDYIINQLAARLAPEYGFPPSDFLIASIGAAKRVVIKQINNKLVGQSGTYQDIIYGAFQLLNAKSLDEPLQEREFINAIPVLNDLIDELNSDGFQIGIANPNAELSSFHNIDSAYWSWLKSYLALKLCTQYPSNENEKLKIMVQEGRRSAVTKLNSKAVGTEGTYQNLIYGAIELLDLKERMSPVTDQEITNALPTLNDLMLSLESKGFELGYSLAGNSTGALHNLPDWCYGWIKAELAARLAPQYGSQPNESIALMVQEGVKNAITRINSKAVGVEGTARNLIYSSIELLSGKMGEKPITETEIKNCIPLLNDLILGMESKGFHLGYQVNEEFDLDLDHNLPDWCLGWIKAQLAIIISTQLLLPVSDQLVAIAASGERNAYMRYGDTIKAEYPETLPTGGKYGYYYRNEADGALLTGGDNFLLDDEGEILTGDDYG